MNHLDESQKGFDIVLEFDLIKQSAFSFNSIQVIVTAFLAQKPIAIHHSSHDHSDLTSILDLSMRQLVPLKVDVANAGTAHRRPHGL